MLDFYCEERRGFNYVDKTIYLHLKRAFRRLLLSSSKGEN